MGTNMPEPLIKIGHTDVSVVKRLNHSEVQSELASPEILTRLEKFAQTIRAVAPKSDDFLYFTIVFLKAAEAALIDQQGNNVKVGGERAWGYFDDSWKWHGNIKPHKNNNGDIFPEKELKIATRSWIGRPLCVDHKSETVDGVRGIILDTHYDEKLKQVVGLCALDKINYPNLARKVSTGVVRYGSMGTAVETSICTECGKAATTPKEYCDHIIRRQAWGEINVGLKPIEYSLVVQPAEPGAILLRCIASINKHKDELSSYGFDTNSMMKNLTVKQADDLDLLLNSVCGPDGCSLEQRERIVRGYLSTNGFTKTAQEERSDPKEIADAVAKLSSGLGMTYESAPPELKEHFERLLSQFSGEEISGPLGETFNSGENFSGAETITSKNNGDDVFDTGSGTSTINSGPTPSNPDSFEVDGDVVGHQVFTNKKQDTIKLSSITEEIMNESRLRKRAQMRRRLAYPQGGAAPASEPNTYKDEGALQKKIREQDDKQMHPNPANTGGADGMFPGDKELKEKLLRAEELIESLKKESYHYGGAAPAIEPSTFTSEDYHKYWDSDKHMHQTKGMGGDKGMYPGDEQIKQHQKRAGYKGPALSTKFKQKRALDGSINKEASCFEVYAGDKLVIAATAKDIFGKSLVENWDWLASQGYAKAVVAAIREEGIQHVGMLLTKQAQDMPLPEMPADPAPMEGAPEEPAAEMPAELPMGEEEGLEEEESAREVVDNILAEMEDGIEKLRTAISDLAGGEDVDINVNVGGEGEDAEKMALSRHVVEQLKVVLADAHHSADELALLSETYEKYDRLSNTQRKDLKELSRDALRESADIFGQSKSLLSVSSTLSNSLVKTSEYVEEVTQEPVAEAAPATSEATSAPVDSELISNAMELRKQRRQALLRKATDRLNKLAQAEEEGEEGEEAAEDEKENEAHDGIGMKENAPVAGVATDTAESVATKQPSGGDHKPAPSKGNQDAQQHSSYSGTPARQQAESGTPSPNKEHAADDAAVNYAMEGDEEAEEASSEELEGEANDAQDGQTAVQAKLTESFMNKKAEEERESYRVKLRRAYDVAMEMQRKGLLAPTKPALDRQVDNMMEFDDKSFEAFKRSVAAAKKTQTVKTASDVTGLNVGVTEEDNQTGKTSGQVNAETLASMWK
jgi:hypothetical protein